MFVILLMFFGIIIIEIWRGKKLWIWIKKKYIYEIYMWYIIDRCKVYVYSYIISVFV